ncbi:hypothetical protein Adu01nite_79740 [Paractinoplanes durhamensis]|uniref:Glycoside hydrolase family 5 domain-containing protein n=1 Tax=Paractinoplanes durhamensis TaxID=113563 RepID=A0ABQ3Z9X3_9ACTN|nr:hypothetical protein Adu01nite_79740 [Actinoplanes durhamensis]
MKILRKAIAFGLLVASIDFALSFSHPATSARQLPLRPGISYGDTLVWMSEGRLNDALSDAETVGATWVRADLSWQDVQADGPGKYWWDGFDRLVRAARSRELTVLPVLAYTPAWARPAGCDVPACAPADPAKFAAFAKTAAERYRNLGVHTWEIWNEPNAGFWKPAPDPRAYAALLKASAAAIRAADPKAQIIMGGLAANPTGPGRVSQVSFLSTVSKLGGNRVVNAVAYHPYTYPFLPSAKTRFGTSWEKMRSLRKVLADNETPDLPIWLTEVGAPTGGPGAASDGHAVARETTHVTEKRQAEIAKDTIATAAGDQLISAVFWYADKDLSTDTSSNENFYGLRRTDGSAKPALAALREAIGDVTRPR